MKIKSDESLKISLYDKCQCGHERQEHNRNDERVPPKDGELNCAKFKPDAWLQTRLPQ